MAIKFARFASLSSMPSLFSLTYGVKVKKQVNALVSITID
jgi:hypothetical protein